MFESKYDVIVVGGGHAGAEAAAALLELVVAQLLLLLVLCLSWYLASQRHLRSCCCGMPLHALALKHGAVLVLAEHAVALEAQRAGLQAPGHQLGSHLQSQPSCMILTVSAGCHASVPSFRSMGLARHHRIH